MNRLLFEQGQPYHQVALLEEGELAEYVRFTEQQGSEAESIYLGKVGRRMKNLGATFVHLVEGEGFLPLGKQEGFVSGDRVLVQVKKPGIGGKAPYLTQDIALTGKYLVYLPLGTQDRVSRRIEEDSDRQQLLQRAHQLQRETGAFIMRYQSLAAEESALAQEAAHLIAMWQGVAEKAKHQSAPALLLPAPHPVDKLLRDLHQMPDAIITNAKDELSHLQTQYAKHPMQLYNVPALLRKALRRKVYLPSGATLVIDPCEALTVIDVNTAKNVAKKTQAQSHLAVNLEAAAAIARLLRLRGTGGMVLIDFIDMSGEEEREQVAAAMRVYLKRDRVKTVVHGFTALGLLEMTRTRSDVKLEAERGVCPICGGAGILTPDKEETLDA